MVNALEVSPKACVEENPREYFPRRRILWSTQDAAGKLRTIDLFSFILKLLQSEVKGRDGPLQKARLAGTGEFFQRRGRTGL